MVQSTFYELWPTDVPVVMGFQLRYADPIGGLEYRPSPGEHRVDQLLIFQRMPGFISFEACGFHPRICRGRL